MNRGKKEKRSPTFKDDFIKPGKNDKKLFQTVLTKYGLSGYKMGVAVPNLEIFADFLFKDQKIAVFIDPPNLYSDDITQIEDQGYQPFLVSGSDQDEWLEVIAALLGVPLREIQPKHAWFLGDRFLP